jgi:nucleotide-binding universal stress UspA family protein
VTKVILIGLDLSEPYGRLLEQGEEFAQVMNARLRLVYVAPPDPSFLGSASWPQEVRDGMADELKEDHTHLVELAKEMTARGVEADSIMARGSVQEVLLEQIDRLRPLLVMLGSRRDSGILGGLTGGVVRAMLRKSTVPVLVIPLPEKVDEEFRR